MAAQQRVIAIVDMESMYELDRAYVGLFPMREYSDFAEDVKKTITASRHAVT